MADLLAIFLIVLAGAWIGFVLLIPLFDKDSYFEADSFEFLLIFPTFGLILFGWPALILAELAIFSLLSLIVLLIVLTLLGFGIARSRGVQLFKSAQKRFRRLNWQQPAMWQNGLPNGVELIILALWILVMLPIYMRPHKMIVGAADAGIYINLATVLNHTGGLILENELIADLSPEAIPGFLRQMPESVGGYQFWSSGLLIVDQSGRIHPAFYHLQSVWQAVGIAIGGLSAGLLVTPMWGMLSTISVYAVVRRLIQRHSQSYWFAILTLIALSVSTLQVWFSRYGTSEALNQFLFWAGLWAFIRWSEADYKSTIWASLAGLAWGMTFVTRIDTFFVFAILAILLTIFVLRQEWRRSLLFFIVPLVILQTQSVWHSLIFSEQYFYITFGYMLQVAGTLVPYLILVGLVGLALIWFCPSEWFLNTTVLNLIKWVLGLTFAVFFFYNLFLRPNFGEMFAYNNPWDNVPVESWNHENLRRLSWYLSPVGLAGAFFGTVLLISNLGKKNWSLIVLGLIFTFLYIWDIRSNAIHIYSQRRYVPMVIPFFIVATGLFLNWWVGRTKGKMRALVWAVAFIWIIGLLSSSIFYSRQVDFRGIPEQIEALAESFPERSILLFNQTAEISIGDFVIVPLSLMHNRHGFIMRHVDQIDPEIFHETLVEWDNEGYDLFWIALLPEDHGHPWPLDQNQITFQRRQKFSTTQLESIPSGRPTQIFDINWELEIYEIDPNG